MKSINVAISGFGGIGTKVAALLLDRCKQYQERYAIDVRIVGVCGAARGLIDEAGLTTDRLADRESYVEGLTGAAFIEKIQANVLFEATPTDFRTGGAGLSYIKTALTRHMHVIAISKGALAYDYAGLQRLASQQQVALKASGAAGSAMPTIDLVQYNLAGSKVLSLQAIVTGTTNIILSEMMDKECSFEAALGEAQRLGVAESDPTLDTDGWDTACKIAILSGAAFGTPVNVERMPRQGIANVTLRDIRDWRAKGLMPRLVGRIELIDDEYQASVGLELFDESHPFYRAHGRTKAISVKTDLLGDFTIVGGGSSPFGTAAAALKDFEHVLAMLTQPASWLSAKTD